MTIDVHDIAIPIDDIELEGSLAIPTRAAGFVIFAHGSSSRHSPRNRHVATLLNERGLATLLFDLLTADEGRIDATLRFDVDMLAERLVTATDCIVASGRAPLPIGYGGPDTWVLQANREAAAPHEVVVVPGATHLFEELGTLYEVARLAGSWFVDHFTPARVKEAS